MLDLMNVYPQYVQLSIEEKLSWGTCIVCGAKPGHYCDTTVRYEDLSIGMKQPAAVHTIRYRLAPDHVKLFPSHITKRV